MRNPDRIDDIVELLRQAWHLTPDWRLGQLVCNLARARGRYDSFFLDDFELKELLTKYLSDPENFW